ncbi:hypothetical protein SAMD00019534_068080 [Acytostelium subglobosum LB1]|uniref:hypothetical protein n=1 Tax=Acytostelium subglobosum LB1 TaxID=1410327 RepID=UPI000644F22D|nr:hypothetical protein SAMD00019534_068080 [Acytostelium subglobosum LB1]GAM23633.1 hypothetical protein SAMD00019534_068080 [Acytostelium subglobosum LB1]|eukprot:XP_012753374.1 hypothetical protein SAMD00019534_068080 [Acytostelium subglobosum LB1]
MPQTTFVRLICVELKEVIVNHPGKKDGDVCADDRECKSGMLCVNSENNRKCRNAKFLMNGQKCRFNYECVGSLVCEDVCVLNDKKCNVHQDCPVSQYCKENVCIEKLGKDDACTFPEDLCNHPYICSAQDSSTLIGKCTEMFAKEAGDLCFSQFGECNMTKGYVCPATNGLVSSCLPTSYTAKQCSGESCDQLWGSCECRIDQSNSTCQPRYNQNYQCQDLYVSYRKCMTENNCVTSYEDDVTLRGDGHQTNPKSCGVQKCAQEMSCYYASCLRMEFKCGLPSWLPACPTNLTTPKIIAGPTVIHTPKPVPTETPTVNVTETPTPKNETYAAPADESMDHGKNTGFSLAPFSAAVVVVVACTLAISTAVF